MTEMSNWVMKLPAEKLLAMAERLKAKRRDAGEREIRPLPRPLAPVPLAFAQERLWFLDRLAPGNVAYNIPSALRMTGRLSAPALAASLSEIVRRHETLRTRFVTGAAGPLQVVDPPLPIPLPLVDLRALAPARRLAEVAALAAAEAARPFDLATGPMLRGTLVALSEALSGDGADDDHATFLTMHHIASDGWSAGLLVEEMATLYGAILAGRPSPLAPLPIQYADFAVWQRARLAGETLEAELRHWREALAGAPVVLDLPADRPRPAAPSFRGSRHRFTLPAEVAAGLRELAQESGTTLFMVGLAAFQALLHRLTGQATLLAGSTIANRPLAELERLIGFFINTLVLRSDLDASAQGGGGWRELLGRTRARTLAAYAHQDLPFERLVEMLAPERDPRVPPLVQTIFQLRSAGAPGTALSGLAIRPLASGVETAKFDLVVNLAETGREIGGDCFYNSDLLDATTAARWMGSLARILAAVASQGGADLAVGELALLSEAERHQLVAEWGGGGPMAGRSDATGAGGSLHAAFAAAAAAAPAAIAVVCAGDRLTYGELDARANRLARRLLARGVAPGSLVGLCLERSLDLVAAILGILKAGCAYVPLDPDYPAERLAFLLADSGVAALLTRRALAERLPLPGPPRLLLDGGDEAAALAAESAAPPPAATSSTPRDLAYVLYTSGSTGRPKGVLVEHGNVLRLFAATAAWFGFGPADVWTLFHSTAFDFSVWELWGALLHGGRLVVVPYAVSRSPADFHALLRRERVTVLSQTPSAFRQLAWADEAHEADENAGAAGEADGGGLGDLRYVVFGGEALAPEALAPWLARHGEARPALVNMYGITETTVHVTYRPLGRADLGAPASPIGRPIPDLAVHVVDADLQPVPAGVPGEMLVGGAGVARGYLGRPELTAERFVPDLSAAAPGARLYRSGDLARWLPTGELAYLGRLDHQVKVRGFRVELGEIETALGAHPTLREAVVLARREEAGGEPRLIAYLAVEDGDAARAPSAGELRAHLAATLPDYMLPAAYVALAALPLTPHGKVDRRALAALAPAGGEARAGAAYAPPQDDLERFLTGLFATALKVEQAGLGIHDGFFELGGNSIAGAVLVNRLQQELGEIVQVVVIFDAPTVARLADHLRREHPLAVARRWPGAAASAPALGAAADAAAAPRIGDADLAEVRRLVRPSSPARSPEPTGAPRNPRALFVLAPPRSGTTLLRVMLGGHPRLFAPPELELLSFHTLAERRAAFAGGGGAETGRDAFWLEGAIRAVMEARGVSAGAARSFVEAGERAGWSTARLYAEIQAAIGGRTLVDKTPSYALDAAVLRRAEEVFEAPLYLHLVRHPCGMIHSFEEAKLDQLFFRRPHRFTRRQLAELIWTVSQENILGFLAGIPAARRRQVAYEDLVARPEETLAGICELLELPYHPAMADPYQAGSGRMTDGLHAASRMLGDVKFLEHRGVDAAAAERWREALGDDFLGEPTRLLAADLGYAIGGRREGSAAAEAAGPAPAAGGARGAGAALIGRAPRRPGVALPLSFAQERLWLLDRLEPGRPFYNLPLALRLRGPLDVRALLAGFAAVVVRHETLRTTIGEAGGRPAQRIAPPGVAAAGAAGAPARVDLSRLAADRRSAEARELAGREASRPFDLARGPLARAVLLTLAADDHAALLTLHHIIADGWSLGVLVRELGALYAAEARGPVGRRPVPALLRALPVQYADFAAWQRAWLAGPVLEAQLAYWRRSLAGAPSVLELPFDRPRPAVRRHRGRQLAWHLDAGLVGRWEALARRSEATLFMALLAALAALLARLTGEDDLVIGSPVAGRNRTEIEGLVGFFVNTLALRARLAGDPDAAALFARVRAETLGAYAHQDLPFERLVEELRPERTLAVSPIFQVMLSLQNAPIGRLELGEVSLEPVVTDGPRTAKFDLSLLLSENVADGVAGGWEYDTDLFDRATVERLGRWLAALLDGWLARPEARVSELPLLSDGERRQLAEWGSGERVASEIADPDPGLDPEAPAGLQAGFAAWAAARPDDEALVWGDERVTYGELAARTNRLARRLRELGAGPETLVGVCLPRSPDLVVALLAVLTAGAAYVPLDPAYPADRLGFMLEDTQAPLVLAVSSGPDLDGAAPLTRVLLLDDPAEQLAIARHGDSPLPLRTVAGNLAYVLYTSGSTGRPKGVAIEHRSVLALFAWAAPLFGGEIGVGGRGGILAGTSIAFDVSVFELFFTLAHGGRVILAENSLALPRLPAASEVTLLNAVPSAVAELLRQGAVPRSVRTVNLPGEPLAGKLVEAVYATGHVERVLNLYGPSEDTTYSTFASVPRGADREPAIGRPIRGTIAHVLDRHLRPLPPGLAGELFLGGAGLARGYLARPELTAERFVPSEGGSRLYGTGDLVRYRASGELEFLGRLDHQVKLRGFRIELGEVEAALAAQPAVGEAAVVVRRGRSGEPELAAFYTLEDPAAGGAGLPPAVLRAALRERLPEPMVPAAFVPLPALPLNPNGKIDRRALIALPAVPTSGAGGRGQRSRIPPRDTFEVELARLWEQVLGVAAVGAADSFFELGGHSLLAAQLVSRVRESFGVDLPLRRVFEVPVLADLARAIESAAGQADGLALAAPPIPRAPRDRELPLSFAQERLWFLDRLEPGRPFYNMPMALRLRGALDVRALGASHAAVVARHEALRTTFAEVDGRPVQVIAPADPAARPAVVDLAALPAERREAEAASLAGREAMRPFDLARGPLQRATLLALAADDHAALFTMHHIVSDGWSMSVLVRELGALYAAFASTGPRAPSPLPPLPIQYADFAVWQRAWLAGPVLARQLAFWRQSLGGAPPVLDLPLDRPRPPVQTFRGATSPLALAPELSRQWNAYGRGRDATLFMSLAALLTALLTRITAEDDIVVGTPIAGRNRLEIEGLIGFFVNTLALRGDVRGDPGGSALLARIRESTLSAFAHQDLPFERLVEELQPERSLAVSPLFQVLFALQNAPAGRLQLAGLTLEPVAAEGSRTAKFDLSLLVGEIPGGGIAGSWEYNTDLFDAATVERMSGWLAALAAGWLARPEAPLSELPILSASEERQLAEWGAGGDPSTGTPVSSPDDLQVGFDASLFERFFTLAHGGQAILDERSPAGGSAAPAAPAAPRGAERGSAIGRPIQGIVAHVLDRDLRPVPPGVAGELCLGGAGVARGVLARPELTAERFVPAENGCRLFRTGERVRYRATGALERLERPQARAHRGAAAGEEDVAVARAVAVYAPPRDEVERDLAAIWEEVLGVPRVGVAESFFELGGHSLLAVRLMSRIARRFGRELPLATLFRAPTIERLAELLRGEPGGSAAAGAAAWSPLVQLAAGGAGRGGMAAGAKPPFFCVHPIGGAVFCYRDLARRLGAERPFYGLQARGLAPGEPPFEHIEEMAAAYREAITAAQPSGPYHLGGWSFGALVALEIARQLRERGARVAYLALIDPTTVRPEERGRTADDVTSLLVVARDVEGMAGMAGIAPGAAGRPLGLSREDLEPLSREARLDLVLARATAAGGLPTDADPLQLRRLVGLYHTHVQAIRAYELPRYGGPLALFRAAEGPLAARMGIWEEVAAGGLAVQVLPGGHYDLLHEPQIEALAAGLRAGLAAAAERADAG